MANETNERVSSWEERRKQFSGNSPDNESVTPQLNSWEEKRRQFLESGASSQQSQLSDTQMANLDIPTDEVLAYHDAEKPRRPPETGNPVAEAGKGLLQTGVNAANIVPAAADVLASFGAWAGQAVGGDGTYQPSPRLELPEELKPQDKYAKLGAEIGPYLIPLLNQEKVAVALSSVANPIERGAIRLADAASENIVGALAQNSSDDNAGSLASDLGIGMTASGAAKVLLPLAGKAYGSVSDKVGDLFRSNPPPSGGGSEQIESVLRRASAEQSPDLPSTLRGLDVNPKGEVVDSARRLGLEDDLLPSHTSGNQQYQAVEQAIKSRVGSSLKTQEDQAILKLSQSAGRLIDDVAKVPDALSLNQKVIGQFENRMLSLESRSDSLYRRVDSAMPPQTRVEANHTARALEKEADDLGGWANLDPIQTKVLKAINPVDGGVLTYANLNKQRRLVGQALYKNRGPYKDADEGALKYLYRNLSEDQRAILGASGVSRDFEVAQRLVQMRKGMEDQMIFLRGKNLTGDLANKGSLAIASLAKGNSKQFVELMNNLPTRQMRQEVAGVAIRDMLSAGKRGADFNPAGFADWYQNLRASGNLRLLAQRLPNDFMKGLHDTYIVANSIRRAKSFEITTGRLNEFTKRFDKVTAPYEFAAKHAERMGVAAGANLGSLGALAGGSLGKRISDKARKLGGSESSNAADRLIASTEFQQAAKGISIPPDRGRSKLGKAFDEAKLRTSEAWSKFYNALPDSERKKIARMGFLWWVSQDKEGR